MSVFRSAHFLGQKSRNVDKRFDSGLQFDEGAELPTTRVIGGAECAPSVCTFRGTARPPVVSAELLQAERDAALGGIDLEDADFDLWPGASTSAACRCGS